MVEKPGDETPPTSLLRLPYWQDGSCCHPLRVAVGDEPAAPVGVPMLEDAIDHVGHGFEAPVRVPRSALGLTRRIVHLTHLIHVDEWIESTEIHSRERPAHWEALALEAGRRGRHRDHLTVDRGGIWLWDPWQGHGVGADGWHVAPRC
jgi:hypothetical protein